MSYTDKFKEIDSWLNARYVPAPEIVDDAKHLRHKDIHDGKYCLLVFG